MLLSLRSNEENRAEGRIGSAADFKKIQSRKYNSEIKIG